jgi:hypothetical protein
MLTEDQIRSLRAVVASRHSTPAERAAAQAKLDAPKARPADPDPDDSVRRPSEAEKTEMRVLLGGLAGEFQLPDPPSRPDPEPTPPRVPSPAILSSQSTSGKQTKPIADVGPDDDPESLARAQELTARHARLRAQGEGLQLVHEVRVDRDHVLFLQPSDQNELDEVWGRQKMAVIECSARGSHRQKDCVCLETAYQFWRDLQVRHDPDSPLRLGCEFILVPAVERFAREYKTPAVEDADPNLAWQEIWRDVYRSHGRS